MKHLPRWGLVVLGALWASSASAQGFGQRPGQMGGGGQQQPKADTPAGPAEAAPEEKEGEPELPPLPAWPGQETKKLQLFQMKGYFRFRWNMNHNLNVGLRDEGGLKAPFYRPISEDPRSSMTCAARRTMPVPGGGDRGLEEDNCPAVTLGGADMRLRLEPTVNISEQVRIHTQFDVFDNLALGSTPQGLSRTSQSPDVPLAAFSDGQAPPVESRNSNTPAIVVKRAWAEVGTPFGQLRFGRMPVSWGMGMIANDGSCWNCDWGDNADRLMFTTILSGHTFGMGYDFTSSGPNTLSVSAGTTYYGGQPIDLEKLDDINQLFWVAGRIDPEEVIRDRVDRGELVLNYGLYLLWRRQNFDYANDRGVGYGSSEADLSTALLERHAWMLTPDLWFKLLWKRLSIEFEFAFHGGQIENVSNLNQADPANVLQFGWALRSQYGFLQNSLRVGLDLGMASGDQAEPDNADVDRRRYHPLGRNADGTLIDRDGSLREFRFDYDYQVDLILFREILGCVSNAIYFKPWIQYNILDSFGARFDLIYSLTHEPVGTPGNARNLGVEMDLDVFYRNVEDGFYAGLSYGVLFPLGALSRPEAIYGTSLWADPTVAHTLQGRLLVKF